MLKRPAQPAAPAAHAAENALLLAAARCQPTPAQPSAPPRDWDYLYRAAERQGLLPLVYRWSTERETPPFPTPRAEHYRSAYWSNHFRNEVLLQELAAILLAAAARDVPVMPLKGAALILDHYPDPALRPLSDLDLLIPATATATFAHLLREHGYRELPGGPHALDERHADPRHREYAFIAERAQMPILIEFRSEPLDPGLWPIAELDPQLSARLLHHAEQILRRGQLATFRGAPYLRSAPEDLLLHVACHMATRHADFRLIWLHDLGRIALGHPTLDWPAILATARALRLAVPVLAALEMASRWVGAPLPLAALRAGLRGPRRGPRAVLDEQEYRLLTAALPALDRADLTAPPPSAAHRKVVSVLRVRGVASWLRTARWTLVPGGDYIAGWRGRPDAATGRAYVAAVLLRLLLGGLRVAQLLNRWVALAPLARAAQRLNRWLRRIARLHHFPALADRFPDNSAHDE